MTNEEREQFAQRLRNSAYAISGILALFGIVLDETVIEPIVMGVIGVINLITIVLAWWYSRRRYVVAPVSGAHSPVS